MAGSVVLEQSSVSVVPGSTATCTVRVRNTGTVVDSFSLTVLGQPAAWTTVVPAALSLFPGADGTIELHFAPPRTATVGAGGQPFGVRVVGSEDPDNPVVEEGEVQLLPFVEVAAKLTPRTSETKRKARHEVVLDNKGNAPVSVALSVSDPDEQLAFELRDSQVTVEAGQSLHVPLKVAARKGFAKGADKHRPFQVKVIPDGAGFPTQLDGNLIQKPGLPKFLVPLVAGVVAVALLAAVLPGMLNKDAKGNLQLAGTDAPTTTTAPVAEEPEDPNAPATAEEAEAAAAAELAANGKDPDAPTAGSSGGGGGGTAAAGAGGGGAAAGGGTTNTTSLTDSTTPGVATTAPPSATTAPPPPAVTSTSAAPATTSTTSPSDVEMYYVWKQEGGGEGFAHWHYVGGGTVGQTFKATAPFLTEVWLNLSGSSVTVNIRKGGPGGAVVATSPTTPIVAFAITKIPFPKVALTKDQIYYVEAVGTSGNVYAWYSNTNTDYANGEGFFNGGAHGHDLNGKVVGRTG